MNKYYNRDVCCKNKAGALFFKTKETEVSAERSFHYLCAMDNKGDLTWEKQAIHNASLITTDYQYQSSGLPKSKIRNGETSVYGYDNLYRPPFAVVC